MISKQEATVLLANLDLVTCTESIETVSISNTKQIRKAESTSSSKSLIDSYMKRPFTEETMSLHKYFHSKKNNSSRTKKGALIPHYVGVCGTPKFPVTTDYAKHQLIVHKPWRSYPTSDDWIAEFNCYINSPDASITAKLTYQRVHARFLSNTQHCQPTADTYDHSKNPIDCSDKELLDLLGIHNPAEGEIDDSILQHLDKGINFNWDKTPKVSHQLY